MGRFYCFYAEQKEIVAQVVQQLQPIENKPNTFVAQLVRQIKDALPTNANIAPVLPFPNFLGMIPWGHNIEVFEGCKSVKEAVFYIERTIQNNWSRAMLSHAIAADFHKDAAEPLNNFALTLPKPQGDLAAAMMKSELNLGFLRPQDNPTIGILICQKANREKVEWTLEGLNKPIGVSNYTDNLMRMVEEHLDALQVMTVASDEEPQY